MDGQEGESEKNKAGKIKCGLTFVIVGRNLLCLHSLHRLLFRLRACIRRYVRTRWLELPVGTKSDSSSRKKILRVSWKKKWFELAEKKKWFELAGDWCWISTIPLIIKTKITICLTTLAQPSVILIHSLCFRKAFW